MSDNENLPPQVFVVNNDDDLSEAQKQSLVRARTILCDLIRTMQGFDLGNHLVRKVFIDALAIYDMIEFFLFVDRASCFRANRRKYSEALVNLLLTLRTITRNI